MHHEVEVDGLVAGRSYSFYVATAQSSALPPECESVLSSPMAKKYIEAPNLVEPDLDDDQFWKYLQRRDACNRLAQAIHSVPRQLRATALDAPVRVAIVGDTRAIAGDLPTGVIDAVTAESPDLVVHTGDVVSSGADGEWQTFFDASSALLTTTPLAPVPGERDRAPWGDRFAQLFGGDAGEMGRTYSIDLGAVHLAFLDSSRQPRRRRRRGSRATCRRRRPRGRATRSWCCTGGRGRRARAARRRWRRWFRWRRDTVSKRS